MKIITENLENLSKIGVYKIQNLVNGKYYIGSTVDSFNKRLNHHYHALIRGNHKNDYLQNAWNKYGEEAFEFIILEVCEFEQVRDREQYYINQIPDDLRYNINLLATGPCLAEESIQKQANSEKQFYKECLVYYEQFKEGEIGLDSIPERYQKRIKSYINLTPWNKGKKYESTDHLKVPKKVKGDRSKDKNIKREKLPIIYVYDENKNFIDSFRSAKDLEDLSLTLNLPIKSRFSKPRKGIPVNYLQSVNINKAAKTGKTYKGLYFSYQPLHLGIDDVNEPKSVKVWNDNTEVTIETKESIAPYSVETETEISE